MTRYNQIQKFIYDLLHAHELYETPPVSNTIKQFSNAIRIFIAVLIILGIVSMMLETVSSVEIRYSNILKGFDLFITIIFSIEYVLRVWSIRKDQSHGDIYHRSVIGRLRYIRTPMAIVDFLSSFPFFFTSYFLLVDLRVIRLFRMLRIFRVLKIGRYSSSLSLISIVIKRKKEEIIVSFLIFFILLIISSTIMFHLENGTQPSKFPDIPSTLWWGVQVLTQNGYGDVFPMSISGKIFSSILSILGIGFFAVPTGIVVQGLLEETKRKEELKRNMMQLESIICPACKTEIDLKRP